MSEQQTKWGSPIEHERRNRIYLSVYAYLYEFEHNSPISDDEFDELSLAIKPEMETGHPVLDKFFREEFDPSTGMWIHKHPELDKVREFIERMKAMHGVQD